MQYSMSGHVTPVAYAHKLKLVNEGKKLLLLTHLHPGLRPRWIRKGKNKLKQSHVKSDMTEEKEEAEEKNEGEEGREEYVCQPEGPCVPVSASVSTPVHRQLVPYSFPTVIALLLELHAERAN